MHAIDRWAVIVIPGQPFLEWLRQADPTSADLTLKDLRDDPSIYLLPQFNTHTEALRYLKKHCKEVFEEQLDGWYRDTSTWPPDRSFRIFSRWFEYHIHSVLMDLVAAPAVRDEF